MSDKIALLDLDSIAYACFHPNKVLDDFGEPKRSEDGKRFIYQDKTPEEIIQNTDLIITTILNNCEASYFIGVIKGFNTTKEKLKINPLYKADRIDIPPKAWNFTKEYLKLKWGAIESNGIEVDDYLRIINLKLPNSFICCIDGDLLDLEGQHFCWKKKDHSNGLWITTTKEEAYYKLWSKMITGSHNNTKGIPGSGIKTVEKLFYNSDPITYPALTLQAYIKHFGELKGIKEFHSEYMCLHTLEDYDLELLPLPIEFKKKEEISDEIKF